MLSNKKRIPSIDRFRGFALALMIMFGAAQSLSYAPVLQSMSTHDLELALIVLPGIGFYDLIAPLFVFACGLALGVPSASGKNRLTNVFALLGMGSFFFLSFDPIGIVFFIYTAICLVLVILWFFAAKTNKFDKCIISNTLRTLIPTFGLLALIVGIIENALVCFGVTVPDGHWSVLGSIGIATLFVTPIKNSKTGIKLLACVIMTAVYYLACKFIPFEEFTYFTHGGLAGAFGYGLIALYAFTAMDLKKINHFSFLSFGAILCVLGYITAEYILPSKNAVSVSYALITSSVCCVVFGIFDCFNNVKTKYQPLTVAGKNSLLLYLIHLIIFVPAGTVLNALIGLIPVGEVLHTIVGAVGLILYFLLMSFLMKKANKKGFVLKI